MLRIRSLLALLLLAVTPGCPESMSLDAGPDTPATPDAPAGEDASDSADGGSSAMGDCDTDADCEAGSHCIELVPGGYRVCRETPTEATTCDGEFDDCCDSSDCATGACYLGPIRAFCGGPVHVPSNVCASDECATDVDCPDGNVCAPAGTFAPVATCTYAACRHDSDCTAESGGHCVVAHNSCCDAPVGLLCTYDGDACRSDSDCVSGYCGNDGTRARCMTDSPICPL